jgi:hypothetical protein
MWNNVNFSNIISVDPLFPTSSNTSNDSQFSYSVVRNPNGTVTIAISSNDDILGQNISVTIDPSLSGIPAFQLTSPVSSTIPLTPTASNNVSKYPPYAYKLGNVVNKLATMTGILFLSVFVLSMIAGKMVGIEMMAVVQISFFSLITLS